MENSGRVDQPSVYTMGLTLFRDNVLHYGQTREKLQHTLLNLIAQERRGVTVDQSSIKSVCAMLMELGGGTRLVYEEDFEQLYLAESAVFFRVCASAPSTWILGQILSIIRCIVPLCRVTLSPPP